MDEALEKKITAIAGVLHHIQEERSRGGAPCLAFSPWALHGRQSTMQINSLVQRRVISRRRSRRPPK